MNTIIQTPTNGLPNSLKFYEQLEFEVVSESSPTIVTDGKVDNIIIRDPGGFGFFLFSD